MRSDQDTIRILRAIISEALPIVQVSSDRHARKMARDEIKYNTTKEPKYANSVVMHRTAHREREQLVKRMKQACDER